MKTQEAHCGGRPKEEAHPARAPKTASTDAPPRQPPPNPRTNSQNQQPASLRPPTRRTVSATGWRPTRARSGRRARLRRPRRLAGLAARSAPAPPAAGREPSSTRAGTCSRGCPACRGPPSPTPRCRPPSGAAARLGAGRRRRPTCLRPRPRRWASKGRPSSGERWIDGAREALCV